MTRVVMAAAAACLLASAQAHAQAADSIEALSPGRRAVSLALPEGGGGELGLWKVQRSRLNRGLFLHVSAHAVFDEGGARESDAQQISLSIGPRWRRYVHIEGPVAPFVHLQFALGGDYRHSSVEGPMSTDTQDDWGADAAAESGLGAEWFVARRVSLAAHTGLSFAIQYANGETTQRWSASLWSLTSALMLQLYF